MNKKNMVAIILSTFCYLAISNTAFAENNLILNVVGGGGGPADSGNFSMQSTIGQPLIGYSANISYELSSGYWHGINFLSAKPVTTSSSGSSDGTGGSGVVISEPQDNVARAYTLKNNLLAGRSTTYNFSSLGQCTYEIAVTGKEDENDVAIRVEELKGTSKLVTASAPGIVYKNLNIWTGTEKIKEALLRCKVENSWISSNSLESNDVKILRWDASMWMQLETVEMNKDSTYTYYEAKTDTLSHFAVSGLNQEASKIITIPQSTPQPVINSTTANISNVPHEKAILLNWNIILILIGIVTAAVYLKIKMNKK